MTDGGLRSDTPQIYRNAARELRRSGVVFHSTFVDDPRESWSTTKARMDAFEEAARAYGIAVERDVRYIRGLGYRTTLTQPTLAARQVAYQAASSQENRSTVGAPPQVITVRGLLHILVVFLSRVCVSMLAWIAVFCSNTLLRRTCTRSRWCTKINHPCLCKYAHSTNHAIQAASLRADLQAFRAHANSETSLRQLYNSAGDALRVVLDTLADGDEQGACRATLAMLLPAAKRPVPKVIDVLAGALHDVGLTRSAHHVLQATGIVPSYTHTFTMRAKAASEAEQQSQAPLEIEPGSVVFCTLDNAERKRTNSFDKSQVRQ